MKLRSLVLIGTLAAPAGAAISPFDQGVAAVHERRWNEAMADFLNVLAEDPRHPQAHTYLDLVAREVQSQHKARIQENRLQLLAHTAKRLEDNWMDAGSLEAAILDTTQAEERARQEHWEVLCDQAEIEMELGHWLPAHDLVFRILSDNPGHFQAQRLLSELQSHDYTLLERGSNLSSEERFALEGFYAFSRADYPGAVTAWQKVSELLEQTYAADLAAEKLRALRFEPYFKIAQAHVAEDQEQAQTVSLFQRASQQYQDGQFGDALETYRKVAILNPDYPQLGTRLAQAEAAYEQDRTRRLGEEKRQEVARLLERGAQAIQQEHYRDAADVCQRVLNLDPGNPQARTYLALAQAELHRRHDPAAAEQHYESGLIAYASGKLEEAMREWTLAIRMDERHRKARNAFARVEKELALNKEGMSEVIP